MKEIVWQLNEKQFSYDEIMSGNFSRNLPPFEKSVLEFGQRWLRGQNSFSISTSGSTGTPKELLIGRDQMEASARFTEDALQLQKGYNALLCLNAENIAGKMMLVRSFVTGMNVFAVTPVANPWDYLPESVSIDFVALVPYQLVAVLNSTTRTKLNAVKALIIGGAPVSEKLKAQVASLKCPVFATYGMTETISHIALQKLNGTDKQDYFQVLPGISIRKDERGCLIIAANYLGNHAIVTNDLVELLSPERFRWLGRIDNVINSGGVKLIPEKIEKEVEDSFIQLGIQNRFFISGMDDALLGKKVVLVIEGPMAEESIQRIQEALAVRLPKFERPKGIKSINQFIETPSQKIDRKATVGMILDP